MNVFIRNPDAKLLNDPKKVRTEKCSSCGLYILAYLTTMYMQSQFSQAHSSREINQVTGGSDSLRWLNFENCESGPYKKLNVIFLLIVVFG